MGAKVGAGIIIMSHYQGMPKILGLIGDEKHRRKHGALYDLPKGSLDPGETNWDAAIRETYEETGIPITKANIVAGPVNDSWLTMWVATVPWVTQVHIEINPITGQLEHDGFEWLSREEARKGCYPYLRSFVEWAFDHI